MKFSRTRERLMKHEGEKRDERGRHIPYKDTVGKWTIGWGRNITDNGISQDEAILMINNDIQKALADARSLIKNFDLLDDVRQEVLVDMAFNLGRNRLSKFRLMRAAVQRDDFEGAADQMVDSKWYKQVGIRGVNLEAMMRTGESDIRGPR